MRASAILVSALVLGCTPAQRPIALRDSDRDCGPPNAEWPPLPSLGQDPNPFDLRHTPEPSDRIQQSSTQKDQSYTYRFELEKAQTTETLRAIVFARGAPPHVVGDRGIALVRDSKAGWIQEATGTEENLYALVSLPEFKEGVSSEEAARRAPIAAVGAHGIALIRGADGAWRKEDTRTQADLFAVTRGGKGLIAVGAGGVIVERAADGAWRAIPTYTQSDLFGIGRCSGHLCAVGAAGTIVECSYPDGNLACVPRKPVTKADLRVVTDEERFLGHGVWLSLKPTEDRDAYPPAEWSPWRFADETVAKGDARAEANNHWIGVGGHLVVGMGGAVWLVSNWVITEKPVRRIELPYKVDFYGAAYDGVDGFLVGANGTIVKLGVLGFIPPRICLL